MITMEGATSSVILISMEDMNVDASPDINLTRMMIKNATVNRVTIISEEDKPLSRVNFVVKSQAY